MKKLILTCALLTSVSLLSFAQSTKTTTTTTTMSAEHSSTSAPQAAPPQHVRPTAEQMAGRRSQYFQKQYSLNDNQTKGIYQAELDYMKQMMEYRSKGQQPQPAQAQQMMLLKDQKFKAIMTEDQYAKYAATRPKPAPAKN